MKSFVLSNKYGNFTVLIDDEDFKKISEYKWRIHQPQPNYFRVEGYKKYKWVRLHRFILNLNDPKIIVDHINGNPMDNRKENLRLVTRSQNQINKKRHANNKLGFKGVYRRKENGKFRAQIKINGKSKSLGEFFTAQEAFEAYKKASLEFHKEFSVFNRK